MPSVPARSRHAAVLSTATLIAAGMLALPVSESRATQYFWDGGAGPGNTDWATDTNWDINVSHPGTSDNVAIFTGTASVAGSEQASFLDVAVLGTSLTIKNGATARFEITTVPGTTKPTFMLALTPRSS